MAARYHNITKASKELFVTQPSVSNAIKALEEEFGVEIPTEDLETLTTVGAVAKYVEEHQ